MADDDQVTAKKEEPTMREKPLRLGARPSIILDAFDPKELTAAEPHEEQQKVD